jgi:PAT family beta-lactamase induction signal transducer AmpG
VLLVVLYKLPDAFLGVMFNPFLLDIGFSKTEIAQIAKIYGFAATMLGVFFGGWLVAKTGIWRALWIAACINIPANMVLVAQAHIGADTGFLIFSITAENITGGISTATLIAYLSMLCKTNYTATQYALLSSFAAFGRTWLSTPSGYVADGAGWDWFFGIAAAMTVPSLLLLSWLSRRERADS